MAVYIVVVALSVPGGALLTITGGFLFGWLVGGLSTVIGATIGATIVFLIAKTSLGETLAAKAGPWMAKLSEGFRNDAMNYLLFLRLVPAFPFWLINLAPALLNVPLSTFVIATFIGIIPGTFAFAFLGAGLDSIIDKQREAYQACLGLRTGGLFVFHQPWLAADHRASGRLRGPGRGGDHPGGPEETPRAAGRRDAVTLNAVSAAWIEQALQ